MSGNPTALRSLIHGAAAAALLVAAACGSSSDSDQDVTSTVPPVPTSAPAATNSSTSTLLSPTTEASDEGWPNLEPPAGLLPDDPPPRSLYDPEAPDVLGAQAAPVVDANDGWVLIAASSETFVPIPRGWVVLEVTEPPTSTGATWPAATNETRQTNISISIEGDDDDPRTAMDLVEEALASGLVIQSMVVDDEKAFLAARLFLGQTEIRSATVVSKHKERGWFRVLSIQGAPEQWDDLYAVFQAIVAGWRDSTGDDLSMPIPDTPPEPPGLPPDPPDDPSTSETESNLLGVWEQVEFAAFYAFYPNGTFVLATDDPAPTVEQLCNQIGHFEWMLVENDTVIRVDFTGTPIDWTIVALDKQQLVFEEGTDLFTLTKRGMCS